MASKIRVFRTRGGTHRFSAQERSGPLFRTTVLALLLLLTVLTWYPATTEGQGVGRFWARETVEAGTPSGLHTSVVLGPTGAPHITYIDRGSDAVKYAVLRPGGWDIEVVDINGGFTGGTSLVLDATGRPHVSYFNGRAGMVVYAVRNESAWQRTPVDRGSFLGPNSLAVDSSGLVHLAYAFPNAKLQYASWDGARWTIEQVDTRRIAVHYLSLALDSDDRPHIAYYGNASLNYASWSGQAWTLETVDASGNTGLYASLALDVDDVAHVAYRDFVTRDLRYARLANGSWQLETVDSAGDAGWFASIAVDEENVVHMAYYERIRSELRHARRQSTAWFVEQVDSEGVVGWDTSLAVDSQGDPHISYYDWSRGSLRYARGMLRLAVRTLTAPQVAPTEALLRGELVSLGGFENAQVSFQWRPKGAAYWNSTPAEARNAEGVYEAVLTGLDPDRGYEFRAAADMQGFLEVGETLTFTTPTVVDEQAVRAFYQGTLIAIAGLSGVLLLWLLFVIRRGMRERRREKGL